MSKVLLLISSLFLSSSVITMNEKPKKINGVKLTELGTMVDDEDGFYQSIDTSISENGKVAVLDRGNRLIHVFDTSGKLLSRFGKEGNGPGELNNAGRIFAFNERVVIQNFQKLMVFDYQGKLITEIVEQTFGASLFKTKKGFKYVFDGRRPSEFLSKEFDLKGNMLQAVKNPRFEELKKEFGAQPRSFEEALATVDKRASKFFKTPVDLMPYKDGYVRRYNGEYKFEKIDKNLNLETTITRPFIRVKENWDPMSGFERRTANMPAEQKKRQMAMMQAQLQAQAKLTKGMKNDIQEIVGVYKGYIFLSVASSLDKGQAYGSPAGAERDYVIDVISPNFEFYTQINVRDIGMENMDELNWLTIKEGKMVFEMLNDEIGPYVKVFDIDII